MKACIMIILCSSLLLQGCYSSSTLTEEWRAPLRLEPDAAIIVTLYNGSKIEVGPYHHLELSEPSDLVFGIGEQLDKTTGKYVTFKGKIAAPYVESIDTSKLLNWSGEIIRHNFLLPDGSKIRFEDGNFIVVTRERGIGIWCVSGDLSGRIPFDNIKQIDMKSLSVVKTIICGIGIAGIVTAVFVGAALAAPPRSYEWPHHETPALLVNDCRR